MACPGAAFVSASRIVSLLPSVTEIVVALCLSDRLVGRSHECDYPSWVEGIPAVTEGRLPADAVTQGQIDAAVSRAARSGEALYGLDAGRLAALSPDLVVTQSLCDVCAVDEGLVAAAVSALDPSPRLLSLAPGCLADVLNDIHAVAEAAGEPGRGDALVGRLRARLNAVRDTIAGALRVRVAALEWIDPPFSAGHWVPDQVAAAGGTEVLVVSGARSKRITWDRVAQARPDIVVLMPCGLGVPEALAAAAAQPAIRALGVPVMAVDASGLFSRPGPRLVDGVEVLAALLHPDRLPAPPVGTWAPVATTASG